MRTHQSAFSPPELLFCCYACNKSALFKSKKRSKVACVLLYSMCWIWQSTASLLVIPRADHWRRSKMDFFSDRVSTELPNLWCKCYWVELMCPSYSSDLCWCLFRDWLTSSKYDRAHEVTDEFPPQTHLLKNQASCSLRVLKIFYFVWFMYKILLSLFTLIRALE